MNDRMKAIVSLIGIMVVLFMLAMATSAHAGDWKISVLGITKDHFNGRDWKVMVAGAVTSLVVHELGHWAYAETHGGGSIHWTGRYTHMDHYNESSHAIQQNFRRAGMVGQVLVGSVLTAIPATRHHDFTLGFNSGTMVHTALYTAFPDRVNGRSDLDNLDHGTAEGIGYTIGATGLTYINMKK